MKGNNVLSFVLWCISVSDSCNNKLNVEIKLLAEAHGLNVIPRWCYPIWNKDNTQLSIGFNSFAT